MLKPQTAEEQRPIRMIALRDLDFDPLNPRFARYFGENSQPEESVIERMVTVENVQELMGSIGEQGYFGGEPLLVAQPSENSGDTRYIVVEGNRRLAALKLLTGAFNGAELPSIANLREQAKYAPSEVPCIVFSERRDILRYLGYRHITGPKRWDSLSKARYIKQLKEEFFSALDTAEQNKAIAREIGSKPGYVAQMLTGLTVFEKARDTDFYGLQRVGEDDVDFSLLTTALSYSSISEYVGLDSPSDISAENLDADHSKDLFGWVFAQNEQGNTVLGESRNLRKLAAIVSSPSAVVELKEKGNLETAYLFSEGPAVAFSKILTEAETKLRSAHTLSLDVPDFAAEQLDQLERISVLVDDLQSSIRRAMKRRQREDNNV